MKIVIAFFIGILLFVPFSIHAQKGSYKTWDCDRSVPHTTFSKKHSEIITQIQELKTVIINDTTIRKRYTEIYSDALKPLTLNFNKINQNPNIPIIKAAAFVYLIGIDTAGTLDSNRYLFLEKVLTFFETTDPDDEKDGKYFKCDKKMVHTH